MDPNTLRQLLEQIARGELEVDAAFERLRDLPFADLGFANVDHHRPLRSGTPEVVLGSGKTLDQILAIVREIDAHGEPVLVTRVDEERGAELTRVIPEITYDATSRTAVLARKPIETRGWGPICVVTGGTSDIPVAEEAAVTAAFLGNQVTRLFDVGVAGVHRLLARKEVLEAASVVIVVAGMEGALPSVVGGLIGKPIIAVPTSVGYGASFGGIAALLGMLNSCAAGVTVVNIDNGFGAACAASLINRTRVD
jgi:NCAIR mutase (PurE)-related protein